MQPETTTIWASIFNHLSKLSIKKDIFERDQINFKYLILVQAHTLTIYSTAREDKTDAAEVNQL